MKDQKNYSFLLVIDFWLLLGQGITSLKILEQILKGQPITEYSVSLLVLITSTALSSLNFFEENSQPRGGDEQESGVAKIKLWVSFICSILLFCESLALFALVFAVPYFAKWFPMPAVYFAIVVTPFRQIMNIIYDAVILYAQRKKRLLQLH